jgi:hypothetical protein
MSLWGLGPRVPVSIFTPAVTAVAKAWDGCYGTERSRLGRVAADMAWDWGSPRLRAAAAPPADAA